MEKQIDEIFKVQMNLLSRYLMSLNQIFCKSYFSFKLIPFFKTKDQLDRIQYQISYLNYEVKGLLLVKNGIIREELCRDMCLGDDKVTITRHDRHEEYKTSAYVSIQNTKNSEKMERFDIWFEGFTWLPLIIHAEELKSYKLTKEDSKKFFKVKEK